MKTTAVASYVFIEKCTDKQRGRSGLVGVAP